MDYELREEALKKVKSIRRLYIHLGFYVIMGVFFFLLNLVTDPFDMWFFFPMLPWGVVLAVHHLFVKGIPGSNLLSKEWEEEELERQMEKLQGDSRHNASKFLPYDELDELETLKLRKIQKERNQFLNDDFV